MSTKNYTNQVIEVIQKSLALAKDKKHSQVTPFHLGVALFSDTDSIPFKALDQAQADPKSFSRILQKRVDQQPAQNPPPAEVYPNNQYASILNSAEELQRKNNETYLAITHLLQAFMQSDLVKPICTDLGIDVRVVVKALEKIKGSHKAENKFAEGTFDALKKYGRDVTEQARKGKLDPVIGRDQEIRRVIRVLSRRTKNNPVLIGEPGVGKTAIVEGLAQRIVAEDVPQSLQGRSLISLDMGSLIAGAKYQGEFEERLQAVLKEVQDASGNIILFIDEMHVVLGAGQSGKGAMDAANLLKPMLARGELRCIGATTLNEYREYVEKDAAFERRFQQVKVGEPSVLDTISILRGLKDKYEGHHGVRISDSALVAAAKLSDRYITSRFLPDKAIDLVDEACANTRVQLDSKPEIIDKLYREKLQLEVEVTALEKEEDKASTLRKEQVLKKLANIKEELTKFEMQYKLEKDRLEKLRAVKKDIENTKAAIIEAERRYYLERAAELKFRDLPELERTLAELSQSSDPSQTTLLTEVITADQIAEVVSRWTGIPVTKLNQSDRDKILHLGESLHKRIIGQEEAVKSVSEAILRSRAGLSNDNRPTGSFLFLGPTGVGKTELAKALAHELFDNEKNIIRIDMSEYMEKHSVSRLIGAPPGYVGYDQGGQLTEAVRRNPYSVVLFDEVEKAHMEVFNVLLQVLDDGRLTDGQGRTIDFTNTVIILTSNLGSQYLLKDLDYQVAKDKVLEVVRQHFRPEFLNRLDDVVVFTPLDQSNLLDIVRLQLAFLAKKLNEKRIVLRMDDAALNYILEAAYDPAYGARPLRRYIERNLGTELSRMIIDETLPENSIVYITSSQNKLHYAVSPLSDSHPTDQMEM